MRPQRIFRQLLVLAALLLSGHPVSTHGADHTTTVKLPSGNQILAELADTSAKRRLGLMFREHLAKNQGMLFIFDNEKQHGIWMKNCRIPLDILWLSAKQQVVHLQNSAIPCRSDPCPIYSPTKKALYVLEIKAGLIQEENIRVGDLLYF